MNYDLEVQVVKNLLQAVDAKNKQNKTWCYVLT